MEQPILIKAGDERVKIGVLGLTPKVDCRVIAEDNYRTMIKLLEQAKMLVGNQDTGKRQSVDVACEIWQDDYNKWNK